MDRKLLPYEHQLIDALGITKDEYFRFVAIQQEYADNKVGTVLDVRNILGPAAPAAIGFLTAGTAAKSAATTVAITLTVVGTVFSIGAALLAPKPVLPAGPKNQRRSREQRFAPTFGFNSAQELASYSDPVNLVYTRQNEAAAVRVSGSLVWSSIENFGSTQFMQLMLALGASNIKEIDFTRTAFGQTGLADLGKQSVFIFAKDNGAEGRPSFNDDISGFGDKEFFPDRLKPSGAQPACMIAVNGNKQKGFSQAYTPSTATSLGVFDAIPINVEVISRDTEGKLEESNISIEMPGGVLNNNQWVSDKAKFRENDRIQLTFEEEGEGGGDKQPRKAGEDMRRQMLETLDFGSTYLLGTAKFKLASLSNNTSIDNGKVTAVFKCIEEGRTPSSDYDRKKPRTENAALRVQFEDAQAILADPHTEEGETLKITKLVASTVYRIVSLGNSDFTAIGAENNKVGTYFTATAAGTGTGTAAYGVRTDDVVIKSSSAPKIDISLKGNRTSHWTPVVPIEIERADGKIEEYQYSLSPEQYTFPISGSIAYQNTVREEFMADKPQIKIRSVRKSLRQQRKNLRDLKDDIYAGVFNGEDGKSYRGIHSFGAGRAQDVIAQSPVSNLGGDYLLNTLGGKYKLVGYDQPFINQSTTVTNSSVHYYTFLYFDSDGILNIFNFNGMNKIVDPNDDFDFFPKDSDLKELRKKLRQAEKELDRLIKDRRQFKKNLTKVTSDSIREASAQPPGSTIDNRLLNRDTQLELQDFDDKITEQKDRIIRRSNRVSNRIKDNFEKMHKLASNIIKDDIDFTEALQESLPTSEYVQDPVGVKQVRKDIKLWIRYKEQLLDAINEILADWDQYATSFDNTFFSKCLVKAEFASYDTLSACNSVKFSLKSRLFRRISGRQRKYGDRKVKEYNLNDNGIKSRMVFFRLSYKEVKSTQPYSLVEYVFALRRGSNADFYTQLNFYSASKKKWQFKFEPVYDLSAEYKQRPFTKYAYIENTESIRTFTTKSGEIISWNGRRVDFDALRGYYPDETERGPIYTNEWDMFSVNGDTQVQFSSDSGPEVTLTAVTEQQLDDTIDNKYKDMTMMALGVFSGRGVQDLRSISALVTEGKACRTVNNPTAAPSRSSSYAPDIFLDTVLDKVNGVGKYVDVVNVDIESLELSKRFCRHNNFPREDGSSTPFQLFMDGLIADVGSWREFWTEAAAFSLLELARKNGKDTLVPAVPVDNSGAAADSAGVPVPFEPSALFTAGNILEGSYKEEFLNYGAATEDLIVSVIYRQHDENDLFSSRKSVEVRRRGVGDDAVRETFDASQFITQREQAIVFGKLLCNQRRHVRQGIEFKTFPSEALIEPGDFIYVDVGLHHWDKYSSGIVLDGGVLNAPLLDSLSAGTYSFLLYDNSTGNVSAKSASVSVDGTTGVMTALTLSGNTGQMFVMGQEKPRKRVYRVMEIQIDEESEVSIKAIEYPVIENIPNDNSLRAQVADFRASKFEVS